MVKSILWLCMQLYTIIPLKLKGACIYWKSVVVINIKYILIVGGVFSGYTSSLPHKPLYQNFVAKSEIWGISGKQKKDRLPHVID